jgi:hypothetical protein
VVLKRRRLWAWRRVAAAGRHAALRRAAIVDGLYAAAREEEGEGEHVAPRALGGRSPSARCARLRRGIYCSRGAGGGGGIAPEAAIVGGWALCGAAARQVSKGGEKAGGGSKKAGGGSKGASFHAVIETLGLYTLEGGGRGEGR